LEAWEVPYLAKCTIDVEVDDDPGNDILVQDFELDYWHDPALLEVTSPNMGREMGPLLYDNGDTDGSNGYSILPSPRRTLLDDFEADKQWSIDGVCTYCVAGPVTEPYVSFWTDEDGEPTELIEEAVEVEFNRENTGRSWFGYSEWEYQYEFEPITLEAGRYWVEIGNNAGSNTFLMITQDVKGEEAWLNWDGYGFGPTSNWLYGPIDLNFRLYGYSGGPPPIHAYIQPGTQSIDAVAINNGVWPELDLVCDAEILEFITDPDNGTLQYQSQVVDIDLEEPLGGTVPLPFDDFTFAYEGRYGLFLSMPDNDGNDFKPKNNNIAFGVGVDNTDPESEHVLDPAEPDGENGWYVSDVEVTLSASDPLVADVSSGVKEIKYKVGTGGWQTITGALGTFLITQADDDENVPVEYYAIDNVGNEEDHHFFEIDMDQTDPTIDLTYECIEGNPIQGWLMRFTAIATDATSGMDRVEFFLNDKHQSTVTGPGDTYQWEFRYFQDFSVDIRADAYDIAGNMASDIVIDPTPTEYNSYNMNSQQQTIKILQG
jgi:hypothetical protein